MKRTTHSHDGRACAVRAVALLAAVGLPWTTGCSALESSSDSMVTPMGWGLDLPGHAARASSWDRTGGNHDAVPLQPDETHTLCDVRGPGIIRHIWMTANVSGPLGRLLVIRAYWDGQDEPAIEAPVGDFFGVGHGMKAYLHSWPITVASEGRALNCWWPMPFATGARITITNEGPLTVGALYYYVDYFALDSAPPTRQRFCARYRQAYPAYMQGNYVILETTGRGQYVGTVFSVESTTPNWWGEGDELIEADDHEPIRGTGTEDYFSDAWGTREYSYLWHGTPVCEGYDAAGLRSTLYRFHVLDPIPFRERISVSIEHGTENDRADNLSSVAFWYQALPLTGQAPLAPVVARLAGVDRQEYVRLKAWQLACSGSEQDAAELKRLATFADDTNSELINGLLEYVAACPHPDAEALARVDHQANTLRTIVSLIQVVFADPPAGITAGQLKQELDDAKQAHRTLLRARHDLARRLARARGRMEPGDEVLIETRDSLGQRTPPPALVVSDDFTYSFGKVDDPLLLGMGADFTYGSAGTSRVRFTPDLPQAGRYEVLVVFSYGANAADTRYEIHHADGTDTVALAQRGRPGTDDRNNARWHSLGTYCFAAGRNADHGSVTLLAGPDSRRPNPHHEYRAYADAVRWVYVGNSE